MYGGILIPSGLTKQQDVCKLLTTGSCPFIAGSTYTETVELDIPTAFPSNVSMSVSKRIIESLKI